MLKDRSDLNWELPSGTDSDGNPNVWLNIYECPDCGNVWEDRWSCQCDDECADCGASVAPEHSIWNGPREEYLVELWEMLPEKGFPSGAQPVDRGRVLFYFYADQLWDGTNTATVNMVDDLLAFARYLGNDTVEEIRRRITC